MCIAVSSAEAIQVFILCLVVLPQDSPLSTSGFIFNPFLFMYFQKKDVTLVHSLGLQNCLCWL